MTREAQKVEERFYAEEYLCRRGIQGQIVDGERPDFFVRASAGSIGVEVVSYGERKGRKVDAAWECLIDYAAEFRLRNTDLNRFGARLYFRNYRMPPPRDYESLCEAIGALLRKNSDLSVRGEWRTLSIDPPDVVLGRHLSRIEIYGVNFWSEWE